MSEDRKLYTIKVTNLGTGRVDIHKNLTMSEVEYIKLTPTLEVEILEVNFKGRRGKRRQ